MGIPVLIMGKSGAGKSTSLRNFAQDEVGIINVLGKPLPFRNTLKVYETDNYATITESIIKSKIDTIVIDDAGYLMTNMFMNNHAQTGGGNKVFELYNSIADNFFKLIRCVSEKLPKQKIVYFIMHEDKNDFGDIAPKTIGKALDKHVCIEGLFTVVLRAIKEDKRYLFITQSRGYDVAKSPIDMFAEEAIDNDLKAVDKTIREYYSLGGKNNAVSS